ncbi:MAG: DUF1501 domain-containing protein [Verrucomicrobia bacterium]|nr:MAG: DUF1501 domain-containing protein [Verrucomicrobiota bacterium]
MPDLTRRKFLHQFNCAALSSSAVLNTLLNLKLANHAAADPLGSGSDSKALVCLFFSGGIDSFQMLVPYEISRYQSYAATRGAFDSDGGLALDRNALATRQLVDTAADFAMHPSMTGMHQMATGTGAFLGKKRMAMVTNLGTLVQPITKSQYAAWDNGSSNAIAVPRSLFSHVDQIEQWQTAVPQGMIELSGWAGRAADIIHSAYNTDATSMSISLAGNNVFQVGRDTTQFVITPNGSMGFDSDGLPNELKNLALGNMLDHQYANLLDQSFSKITKKSIDSQRSFQEVFQSPAADLGAAQALFPNNNNLANALRAVLRTIKIRSQLGLRRQTFFVNIGGWDMHGDLLQPQAQLLLQVDAALTAFQLGLETLNLADDVVTFTASDFGRTLRSNGRGTDHAWGGNMFVMGGPVDGGKLFGTYPDLTLDGPDDVGYGGRLLPSTSVDVYFAELLRWFGVPATSMASVLPNIANFWNPLSATAPLGFIKPS